MELRQFKYFLKAKELLNFTEAAKALFISQSTLSQQIKQLEDELATPLFERIGKRIALTEAGHIFAKFASQSIQNSLDGKLALQELEQINGGTLTIGITYGLRSFITNLLIEFAKKYPNVKIKVVIDTTVVLVEKLSDLELDFILTFKEENHEKELKYTSLFRSEMVFVTSNQSEFAHLKSINLKQISQLPLVLPSNEFSTTKFITEAFTKKHLNPSVNIEINDIPILLEFIRTGNWNTILSEKTIENEPNLAKIKITGYNMQRSATIIQVKNIYEKKAVKSMLAMIFEFINK